MYEEYVIGFIDILGFKEIVRKQSFEDVQNIYKIFSDAFDSRSPKSLERSLFLMENRPDGTFNLDKSKMQIGLFSDCVIWTYPCKDITEVSYFALIMALKSYFNGLLSMMFFRGIAVRGGVTIGNLHINGNKIFGPALIRAIELEQLADHPRIVIDKALIDRIHKNYINLFLSTGMIKKEKKFYCFNYFAQIEIANKFNDPGYEKIKPIVLSAFIDPLLVIIQKGIHDKSYSVRRKYEWLRDRLFEIPDLDFDYQQRKPPEKPWKSNFLEMLFQIMKGSRSTLL